MTHFWKIKGYDDGPWVHLHFYLVGEDGRYLVDKYVPLRFARNAQLRRYPLTVARQFDRAMQVLLDQFTGETNGQSEQARL